MTETRLPRRSSPKGERRLVEAAGVEPASESTSSWDSTCVSASGFSCPACGSGEVPPGLSPGESRGHAPRRHVPTSLFNGVRPPTTRRGQGERHCLIKQRERTDCPQLTDVPSDLRVNGARHASRNPVPPSKPNSPPAEVIARGHVHAPGLGLSVIVRQSTQRRRANAYGNRHSVGGLTRRFDVGAA